MLSATSYSESGAAGNGAPLAPAGAVRAPGGWFSATLLRKDLSRFWPLWAAYLVAWLLVMPVMQFTTFTNPWASRTRAELLLTAASDTYGAAQIGLWFAFFMGLLTAIALFSYLYNARSVGMLHSFPIRREGLFLTHYAAGLGILTVVHLVILALTAAVQAAYGVLAPEALGAWLLSVTCSTVLFFSFAAFCAQFTGSGIALAAFYGILSALPVGLDVLVRLLGDQLLYGMSFGSYGPVSQLLTPLLTLTQEVGVETLWGSENFQDVVQGYRFHGWQWLLGYAAAGLALAVLALLLYRRRRSEAAGDVVAVPWARPVFKYGVSLCAALALGMGLYALLWQSASLSLPGLLFCMCLCGAVGHYAAEMLLRKSFRVWRRALPGAAVTVAAVLVLVVGLRLDVLGFAGRVPDAGQVTTVNFSISGGASSSGTSADPELIQKLVDIHHAVLSEREEQLSRQQQSDAAAYEDLDYVLFQVNYDLANGETLGRRYSLYYRQADVDREGSAAALLDAFCRDRNALYVSVLRGTRAEEIAGGSFDYYGAPDNGDGGYNSYSLSTDEARTVYEAVVRDIEAGNLSGRGLLWTEGDIEGLNNSLVLFAHVPMEGTPAPMKRELYIDLTDRCTHTIAALYALGIVNDMRPLWTYSGDPVEPPAQAAVPAVG